MREWLTVIIVLLIIGIVLDGIRRVRAARRERIHMANHLPHAATDSDTSEFPLGGARIVGYRHPDESTGSHGHVKNTATQHKANVESAPVLMDSAEDNEPSMGDFTGMDIDDDVAVAVPARPVVQTKAATTESAPSRSVLRSGSSSAPAASQEHKQEVKNSAAEQPAPQEVIVINVMAHQGEYFEGNRLLEVLTSQNMRFGFMDIFHRHHNEDGSGESLFSVANIVKPGTFDLNAMDDFTTPGISMFMMLPLKGDSVAAFGLMARTAKIIAESLDGELKDEHRSVMTQQTFEHCRQRVIEFERKRRLNR
ncbi:cell division protein ZipA [Marinagarivorans algicola]|uniref:cell division protein ZipA n=1 Tax=Marinagarivorans algicola TaxID=1513270 RepID=UPI00373627F2